MIEKGVFKEIAKEYETPVFVFDINEVNGRVIKIKEILNKGNDTKIYSNKYRGERKINLCYSIKANPFLITSLLNVVDYFEVCSPGELEICKYCNVPGDMIIYSGVNKGIEDITKAIDYGVNTITAESLRHFSLISDIAREKKTSIDMILRLTSNSQFGMSLKDIESILLNSAGNSYITITGIHYFAGTQRVKLKHQKEELCMLRNTINSLRKKYNLELNKLEYGPGLSYPYFEGDDFSDTLSPLKELMPELLEASEWSELTIEMGRFIASSCGYYLTRVVDIKESNERNWCILDGGINHVNYLGQIMGLKVPVIKLIGKSDTALSKNEWALCGSLCTTNDVLVRVYEMPDPDIDDLMVFCNIGAYSVTEGLNLFLSRDMPQIIIYEDGRLSIIRDKLQTWKLNL